MASHDPPERCKGGEMSWDRGLFPNPKVDYDRGKSGLPNRDNMTIMDQLRDKIAGNRTNINDDSETLEEMYTAKGNPERFGGHPPLVQTSPRTLPPDPQMEPVRKFQREG